MRHAIAIALAMLIHLAAGGRSSAAETPLTFGLITDGPYRTALAMRIARGVDHRDGIRVLPVIGKSPAQNLADLMELRGIDLALVPSDSLAFAAREGLIPNIDSKVDYIVKLANLDIHVVAGSAITSLADLAGKRIAIGSATRISYEASQMLIGFLKLGVTVVPLNSDDAIAAVKTGAADAAIMVGVSPLPEISRLEAADGLHLVPIVPQPEMSGVYAPSLLTAKHYPNLLNGESSVETVSSSLVIAAVRWPKGSPQQKNLTRFAGALFSSLTEDSEGAGINLNAEVPGWTRSQAADLALELLADRPEAISPTAQEN